MGIHNETHRKDEPYDQCRLLVFGQEWLLLLVTKSLFPLLHVLTSDCLHLSAFSFPTSCPHVMFKLERWRWDSWASYGTCHDPHVGVWSHWSHSFCRVWWVCCQGTGDSHYELRSQSGHWCFGRVEPSRVVEYKPLLDRALKLAQHKVQHLRHRTMIQCLEMQHEYWRRCGLAQIDATDHRPCQSCALAS